MSRKNASGYFWNSIYGGISSFQSIIIIFFIGRWIGVSASGIFSIGYAIAVLLTAIIKYGIRTYQVTDIEEKYRFGEYFQARLYTTLVTMSALIIYLCIMAKLERYSVEKALTIICICVWKILEGIEDVFVGNLQQKDELGYGARLQSYRLVLSTALFISTIIFLGDLRKAILVTMLLSIVMSVVMMVQIKKTVSISMDYSFTNSWRILKECFPLCVASTIVILIGNMPKYLVDFVLNDELQGVFGYIMSPSYVIVLFSMLIYQPEIRKYAELWDIGNYRGFTNKIIKQVVLITIFLASTLLISYFIGIPVLSFLYKFDLSSMKKEFILLMVGGGIYAIANFLMIPIVTMRKQNEVSIFYIIVLIVSCVVGFKVVVVYQVLGAAIAYILLNLLCVVVLYALIHFSIKEVRERV